jgi:transglutaminase-like putative cysteine protease
VNDGALIPFPLLRFAAMRRTSLFALVLALSLPAFAAAPLSDVVTVPRPASGEYFGLYLKEQKVGYMFSNVTLSPAKDRVTAVTEIHFKAKVGPNATSERHMVETKVFESKPGGRLLSFVLEQKGDGGDQVLEGTATPSGITVVRRRPGTADETLTLPAAKELVEDADQARVALKRNTSMVGTIIDSTDLEQYKWTTTLGGSEQRTLGGVKVTVRKVTTLSEKEKVPSDAWIDPKGRILEVRFGPMMTALAEPEDKAKRVDLVEVFGLTKVVLPKPPGPEARKVPGVWRLVMVGLPEKFRTDSYRQQFKTLDGDKVQVTLKAFAPSVLKPRPLVDPNGGINLKSSIIVEANDPEIQALAKKIAGHEKDAYTAAKLVSRWVYDHMVSDYGSSSDRATDALKQMKGDCTEHSLLTVALLRALGIPSKRVDGVVYVLNADQVPALYWHEWVEAYVGEWTQLDPTFGQDVADATHFAVGEEASAEITPLLGSMKVVEVLPPPGP